MPSEKSLHDYQYERDSALELAIEPEVERVRAEYFARRYQTVQEVAHAARIGVDAVIHLYMKHGTSVPEHALKRLKDHYEDAFRTVALHRLEANQADLFEDEDAF